jgi:hypothetical protein
VNFWPKIRCFDGELYYIKNPKMAHIFKMAFVLFSYNFKCLISVLFGLSSSFEGFVIFSSTFNYIKIKFRFSDHPNIGY